MIDLDELIAEARRLEGDYSDNYEVVTHMSVLADALESMRAERDAALTRIDTLEQIYKVTDSLRKHEREERAKALTRIAELEAELEVAMRPHSECERSGAEAGERIVDLEGDLARAEARIAELEKSYRIIERLYKIERQERIEAEARITEAAKLHRRDSPGLGGEWCQSDGLRWPCPTAVALGLNDGETV